MEEKTAWWWVTTILGALGAACSVAGASIGDEVGKVLMAVGATLSTVLGVTHPGRIQ